MENQKRNNIRRILNHSVRMIDYTSGRWLLPDPMAEMYYSTSPYAYVLNNPIRYIDPDGRSTHTDSLGHVVAVYNDGNMGVYKHGISADTYDGSKLKIKNGTRMGETEYWDEFSPLYADPNIDGSPGSFTINFDMSFDQIIDEMHQIAQGMGLMKIARESKGGGLFDIKEDYKNIGALLNGKYATSRSAGNYLAGYNASTGTLFGAGISFETFQKLAGALHITESTGGQLLFWQKVDIVLGAPAQYYLGPTFKAPTWGESPYQYRMSKMGWNRGKR